MTLRTIYLHGPLAYKFGQEPITLDADELPMLLSGLNSARPGFKNSFFKQDRIALALKNGELIDFIDETRLNWQFGKSPEIHIASEQSGSGFETAGWAASTWFAVGSTSYYIAAAVIYVAMAATVSYVVRSLSEVSTPESTTARSSQSYLFDQPENISTEGVARPLIFGRFQVGSVVISTDIVSEKNSVAMDDSITMLAPASGYVGGTGNVFTNDVSNASTGTLTLTNFTVNGTVQAPGTTYTGTGAPQGISGFIYSVSIASNGAVTLSLSAPGSYAQLIVPVTYTASSSTTPVTSATLYLNFRGYNSVWHGRG
jgi:predicted phage tail protein